MFSFSPPAPPFIAVARRVRYWFVRLLRSLRYEHTLITVFDPDPACKTTIISKSHAPGSGYRVVLPSSLPRKRHARLGGFAVHASEEDEHPQSVAISRERNHSLPDDVDVVLIPLRRLDDPPPTIIVLRYGFVCHQIIRLFDSSEDIVPPNGAAHREPVYRRSGRHGLPVFTFFLLSIFLSFPQSPLSDIRRLF